MYPLTLKSLGRTEQMTWMSTEVNQGNSLGVNRQTEAIQQLRDELNRTEQTEGGIGQLLERPQLPLCQLDLAAKVRVRLGRGPVSRGSRLLVRQVAHNHRESVASIGTERADFDLRLEPRLVSAQLPASAASRAASGLGEQPVKLCPAGLVKQRGRSGAHAGSTDSSAQGTSGDH